MNSKPVRPGPNPVAMQADLERRRSNAARPIPSRKVRRQMSRGASKRAAVRDAS
jgi:hypothetical protein